MSIGAKRQLTCDEQSIMADQLLRKAFYCKDEQAFLQINPTWIDKDRLAKTPEYKQILDERKKAMKEPKIKVMMTKDEFAEYQRGRYADIDRGWFRKLLLKIVNALFWLAEKIRDL